MHEESINEFGIQHIHGKHINGLRSRSDDPNFKLSISVLKKSSKCASTYGSSHPIVINALIT